MAKLYKYDALFIINQDCSLEMICALCKSNRFNYVFLLTTHALFDNELEFIKQQLPVMPEVGTFSSLLNDEDMEKCDDDATRSLMHERCADDIPDNYFDRFIKRSTENKNRLVRDRVMSAFDFKQIYYGNDLGIVPEVWKACGGSQISVRKYGAFGWWHVFWGKVRSLSSKAGFYEVSGNEGNFLFLSSIKRLHLITNINYIGFNRLKSFIWNLGSSAKTGLVRAFLLQKEGVRGGRYKLATTIHEYQGWMSRLGREIYVFVDGYHPENYPRSYIDGFKNCIFMPRNMFDSRWFLKFGMNCIRACSFIQPAYFNLVGRVNPIRTVLLLLNHAGDWSALINRSDTDYLVSWFAKSASLHPDVKFIIRPHPTMAHPRHEGSNSIERISSFVKWCAMQNLEVSAVSFDEDLARGDIFISEYSQTLLDVYRSGMLGLIVNCTNRRSFMSDYESLGFPAEIIDNCSQDVMGKIIKNPDDHIATQNMAVSRYNKSLENYLAGVNGE